MQAPSLEQCKISGTGNCARQHNPDPDACSCPPCPNAAFCGMHHIPQFYLGAHRGTCYSCAVSFGRALSFVRQDFECAICLEQNTTGMHHPSGCAHVFCVDCVHRLVYGCDRMVSDILDNDSDEDTIEDDSEEDERRETRISLACPLCRAKIVPDWVTQCIS